MTMDPKQSIIKAQGTALYLQCFFRELSFIEGEWMVEGCYTWKRNVNGELQFNLSKMVTRK